jgi:ribosomal protein S18 acetylase RimI-like enzyme
MKIIQAQPAHLELVVPLFDQYRQFYKQPSDLARARHFLGERLTGGQSVIFIALGVDDVPIGFTQLYPSFSSTSMKRLWILNDLYVIKAQRKNGVARALMERARQLAVETHAEGLTLETATDNLAAQALYESLGYKRDEAFHRYNLIPADMVSRKNR